jgi:hypothetical protein
VGLREEQQASLQKMLHALRGMHRIRVTKSEEWDLKIVLSVIARDNNRSASEDDA